MITFEQKLGWGLLVAGLALMILAFCAPVYAGEFDFKAQVERVLDGDTFIAKVENCNPAIVCPITVRVFAIDTPESRRGPRGGKCVKEIKLGLIAKAWAKETLVGKTVTVVPLEKALQKDPYGRLLGNVTLPDGKDYSADAIRIGHAREFVKDKKGLLKKQSWCK
jgi:endonuclease YncB( thermonuclease family)